MCLYLHVRNFNAISIGWCLLRDKSTESNIFQYITYVHTIGITVSKRLCNATLVHDCYLSIICVFGREGVHNQKPTQHLYSKTTCTAISFCGVDDVDTRL